MTRYVVLRPFSGSPEAGQVVEIDKPRTADTLARRRYIAPLADSGGENAPKAQAVLGALVQQAIGLISVKSLPDYLAQIDDAVLLTAALGNEARETAVSAISSRITELSGVAG